MREGHMSRALGIRLVTVVGLLAGYAFFSCGQKPTPTQDPFVAIQLRPAAGLNDGSQVDVEVVAQDAYGQPGVGQVELDAPAGQFGNGSKTITLTLDAQGVAWTTYTCDVAQDSECVGSIDINGAWQAASGGVTGVGRLSLESPPNPDAPDSGFTVGEPLLYGPLVPSLPPLYAGLPPGLPAIAPLSNPIKIEVGFYASDAQLLTVNGGIYYLSPPYIFRWVRDPDITFIAARTWNYPFYSNKNDIPIQVPGCVVMDVVARPDTGELVAKCQTGEWRRLSGAIIPPAPVNGSLELFGPRESVLWSEYIYDAGTRWHVRDALGRDTPVPGAATTAFQAPYKSVRAVNDGYFLSSPNGCALYHSDLSGSFNKMGDYASLPFDSGVYVCYGVTDRAGSLYLPAGEKVYMRPFIPAATSTVYDYSTLPTGPYDIPVQLPSVLVP
jgi:hypothetical protein